MAKNILKEIRELTAEELEKKLAKIRRELMELRFQFKAQQLKNPVKLKETRRAIARILTVLKEKEPEEKNAGPKK